MEHYTTGTGQHLKVHEEEQCSGYCPIHNPSDHPLKNAPTHWREDRRILERICRHGVNHPDFDGHYSDDIHGCCPGACCVGESLSDALNRAKVSDIVRKESE